MIATDIINPTELEPDNDGEITKRTCAEGQDVDLDSEDDIRGAIGFK